MTFRTALNISSYLLLLSGFAAVVASGGLEPVAVVFFVLALIVSWWQRPLRISSLQQLLAVLGFLILYGLDLTGSGDLVGATIRLLLLLACFKVLTLGSGRDYLLIYLISFALLLIASVYTLSIVYLVSLIIYLFLSVLTLILFESSQGFAQLPAARFSIRGYLAMAVTITGLTLLLAVPIFLAVPRLTVNFLRNQQQQLTGFSDTVELGDLGALLRNSEIVMRVTVDTPYEQLSPELKWRGIALEHYDGRRWRNRRIGRNVLTPDSDGSHLVRARSPGPRLLGQDITVDPLSHAVFGASDIVQVTLRGDLNQVWKDAGDNVSLLWLRDQAVNYFVYSEVSSRAQKLAEVRAGEVPGRIQSTYLQLPQIDPAIRQLAARVTAAAQTDAEKGLLLENFLRGQFEYTLANPSGSAADPLSHFLLASRAGHCEYFATAQAIMMRTLGIPSRIINGFRAGSYHDWQGHFTVRQSDAHSWVEGYFPGAGWVEFDPTPADRVRQSVGLAGLLAQLTDSLDVFWTEVITFNRNKQAGFFTSVAQQVDAQWESLTSLQPWQQWIAAGTRQTVSRIRANPALLALPVAVLIAIFGLARYRHRLLLLWRRWLPGQGSSGIVPAYYQALLMVLRRRRLVPGPGETPAEFAKRSQQDLRSEIPVRITRLYYRARWGGRELDEQELASLARDLRQLERV